MFVRTEELFADLKAFGSIEIIEPDSTHARIRPLPDVTFDAKADEPAARIKALIESGQAEYVSVAESAGREALLELTKHGMQCPEPIERFSDFQSNNRNAVITLGLLDKGIMVDQLAIVPESQLFGRRVQRRRRKQH